MQAIRQIQEIPESREIVINVPISLGNRVELIILPVETVLSSASDTLRIQETSHFYKKIIGSPEEDVWNDL